MYGREATVGIHTPISLRFFQAEDGIRDYKVTGVQTCALPISGRCDSLRPQHLDVQRIAQSCGGQRIGVARLIGVVGQVAAGALERGADRVGHVVSSRSLRNAPSSSTSTPSCSAFASLLPA